MTTVVNSTTPAPTPSADSGGNSFLVGIILIIGFVMILWFIGLPALRNMGPIQLNVPAPQVNVPAPQVNVPSKVDVNIKPADQN